MLCVAIISLVLGVATFAKTDDTAPLAEKVAQVFTSRFLPKVLEENQKNGLNPDIVLSGFSLLQPLAQLTLASTGESHDELMSNALGLADDADVKAVFRKYMELFGTYQGAVTVTNKLYLAAHMKINNTFAMESIGLFDSYFKKIEFTNAKKAADEINNYVESNTNRKVKDLIDYKDLLTSTDVVVVSSIYFKSEWENKFRTVDTKLNDFFYAEGASVPTKFMFQQTHVRCGFSKQLGAEILQLNYKNEGFYFNIALPKEIKGLPALLQKYKKHNGNLYTENNKFTTKYVQIYLPKFEIETTTDLEPVLRSLGVTKIFDLVDGNLHNLMLNHPTVRVSHATQKVYINVNEEGTEIASTDETNSIALMAGFNGDPPVVFRANLPFYYEVNYYGYTLLSGTVNFDPRIKG